MFNNEQINNLNNNKRRYDDDESKYDGHDESGCVNGSNASGDD